jgi:FSR family fosmidomycin resistance protein-like MFS transporter
MASRASIKEKIFLLSMGHLITDIYPGFLAPILPLLMAKLDFSITKAAILNSALTFSASLAQPAFGYFSDKLKKTYFLIFGPLLAAFFMSFIDLPNNYYLLLLFVFLAGLGVAAFHPQGAALTNIISCDNKNRDMGLFVFGGGMGVAIGALVISTIVAIWGLSAMYYAVLPGLIVVGLLYKFFHNEDIAKSIEENKTLSVQAASYLIIILILLAIVRATLVLGLSMLIPIYLSQQGQNIAYGGTTLFCMHAFGALGGFAGGFFSEKIGVKKVILLSFVVPLPLFYFYLLSSGLFSYLLVSLGAFFLYSAIPVVISLGQDNLSHRISIISSMMMGLCWGMAGLVVIAVGALADRIGVEITLYYLIYSMSIGFFLGFLLLKAKLPESKH